MGLGPDQTGLILVRSGPKVKDRTVKQSPFLVQTGLDRGQSTLSSSERKARYLSYIQNSYASVHSFGTPSITSYLVIPPGCPALSTTSVVVAIGPAGSVPISQGDAYGVVQSDRGPVGVTLRFGVRCFGSEFWVKV